MSETKKKKSIKLKEIREQILEGRFGAPGEPFLGVKALASTFCIGMDRAQEIFYALREEGLIMLAQKRHYLSHGIVPPNSPLGKMRAERKLIALLCDHLESYYIPTFSDSVSACLYKEGYSTAVFYLNEVNYREVLRSLYEIGVQGHMVFTDLALAKKICRFLTVPSISLGFDCAEVGTDSVLSGGVEQSKFLADMMLEEGCKRFYFAAPERISLEDNAIYRAFVERLRERNVEINKDIIITEAEAKNNVHFLRRKLYANKEKTGVVCTNEQITQWIRRWCDENNISVPRELMLAAFRTKSPMNQQRREIITVEENIEKEAAEAAAILLQRIRGDTSPPKVIVVEPKVINRMKK